MREFCSEPIPFVQVGNRRGLTAMQLCADPALADFVKRFPDSFEEHHDAFVMLFIEPDLTPPTQGTSDE